MPTTRIRLIAPSGYPHDRAAVARGLDRLRAAGCIVDGLDALDRRVLRFAGTDAQRAAELNALATCDVLPDLVLAVRGGYGATRLLPHLNYMALRERLANASVVLVGHSDFTAVQLALFARSGLVTFGGPMLCADFGAPVPSALTVPQFWRTVRTDHASAAWTTSMEQSIDTRGVLWGGNLAMLCSLVGTPYFPTIDDGILFVEDVGEPVFRIERLLYQLHLSGVLARQRALILGDFTDCRTGPYDNGYDLAGAFAQIRRAAGIPVLDGLPFGHAPDKYTLPFGLSARLQVDAHAARLDFAGYPHLS
jgi:muramoyltetrapeptide carboxypeptidase